MTSFMISAHASRPPLPASWLDPECAFCRIISGTHPAHKVYEDERVIAILDILPIRAGHVLLIPKLHCKRISELPPPYGAALGEALPNVARALTEAMDNTGLNVVCNQEYAQAVMHVHWHIVPAPVFGAPPPPKPKELSQEAMLSFERDARTELVDDEGEEIAMRIRSRL